MEDRIDTILKDLNNDIIVENILENKEKKHKNSGQKGKRGERGLVEILKQRFVGKIFSRVVGSGQHGSQMALSEEAKAILTGDIVVPKDFKFCIESKHGYSEIDLCKCFDKGHSKIDEFLEQASRDAKRIKKEPMLCWKKDRMPWLTFVKYPVDLEYKMHYRDWVVVSLEKFLQFPDSLFFEEKDAKI